MEWFNFQSGGGGGLAPRPSPFSQPAALFIVIALIDALCCFLCLLYLTLFGSIYLLAGSLYELQNLHR